MERSNPEDRLERTTEELDERLERLEGDIGHARELAAERAEETERTEDFTGDWEERRPDQMIGDAAPESFDTSERDGREG